MRACGSTIARCVRLFLTAALLLSFVPAVSAADSPFVKTNGAAFTLNGQDFYFAGTNNYYLNYKSNIMVDDVFDKMIAMNLKVIRVWGFLDGQSKDGYVMQPQAGVYDESGFKKMDYVIYKAGLAGVKLVIPFVNNWDDFGGMNQYVSWFQAGSHDAFYTNPSIKQAYKNYVSYMLNRTNTYTGVKYKDDPAIMTWELANEPRCQSDTTGDILVNWADEMSTYIKSIDQNHLVAVGDEGFYRKPGDSDWINTGGEGVDWIRLISLPNIDYGTYHLYPDHWNKTADWGTQWIQSHIADAKTIGKPAVMEEFGLKDSSADQATRNDVYKTWTDTVYQEGGAGDQFWILTGIQDDGSLYPDYDGFRVVPPSTTASILASHAAQMNALSGSSSPVVPSSPTGLSAAAGDGKVTLTWKYSLGAASYNVKRASVSGGPYTTVASVGGTTYTDTSVVNGTTYYYAVSVVNSAGESALSAEVSALPEASGGNGGTGELVLQYRAADTIPGDNHFKPHFRIANTGTAAVPLSELTIRYWYTIDGEKSQTFNCDYATVGCSSLSGQLVKLDQARTGADYYLEISFKAEAGQLAPGGTSGEIQVRINKNDWSNYNESDDYSFDAAKTAFADWNKVTLYRNGTLVWGIEP